MNRLFQVSLYLLFLSFSNSFSAEFIAFNIKPFLGFTNFQTFTHLLKLTCITLSDKNQCLLSRAKRTLE